MSDIAKTVIDIIVEKLGVDEKKATLDANFSTDLNADSLDTVELIMEFEKVFGIEIPDDETDQISTIGDAVAYIEKAVAAKQ